MTAALDRVEQAFVEDRHLDLQPWDASKLFYVNTTTEVDVLLGPVHLKAELDGHHQLAEVFAVTRQASKPSLNWMLEVDRQHRETTLLTPVKRVEVAFRDVMRPYTRRWHFTHAKVHRLVRSEAFQKLTQTAQSKGFSTQVVTETFFNMYGDLRVRPKLVFMTGNQSTDTFFNPDGPGRTYTWSETP